MGKYGTTCKVLWRKYGEIGTIDSRSMLLRCPGSAEIPAPVADGSCSGGISFEPTNHPEEFV